MGCGSAVFWAGFSVAVVVVAVGMVIVTRAAVKKGLCPQPVLDTLLQLLYTHVLPVETAYTAEQLFEKALSDKKRSADTLTLSVMP